MPRRTGGRCHRAGGPEVTVAPQGAADGAASRGLRQGLPAGAAAVPAVRAAEQQRGRQRGAPGSATRRAGPGLKGRPRGGPATRAAAALDRGSSEERGSRTPAVAPAREVPARPRSGPVTFQRLEDRLRHLGAAAAAAPPGGARRPLRTYSAGEVGEAPGAGGRVQLGARRTGTATARADQAGTARWPPLPCSGSRRGRGGHDPQPMTGLCRAGLTAAPTALTERVGGTPRSAPIGWRTDSPHQCESEVVPLIGREP